MIRNLFALIGLLFVTFAVVGYFRGWYKIETGTSPTGDTTIQLDIQPKKTQDDLQNLGQKIQNTKDELQNGKNDANVNSKIPVDPNDPNNLQNNPMFQPVNPNFPTANPTSSPNNGHIFWQYFPQNVPPLPTPKVSTPPKSNNGTIWFPIPYDDRPMRK